MALRKLVTKNPLTFLMEAHSGLSARIAEEAGASAVMAHERVPAQIRKDGGVARASDPGMIKSIQKAVSIPVMALFFALQKHLVGGLTAGSVKG